MLKKSDNIKKSYLLLLGICIQKEPNLVGCGHLDLIVVLKPSFPISLYEEPKPTNRSVSFFDSDS